MNSCHNKPIRGQSCSANQRAQLSGQMYSEFVYFKSVKRVCCWPNPKYCKVCFNPIYLQKGFRVSLHLATTLSLEDRKELDFKVVLQAGRAIFPDSEM